MFKPTRSFRNEIWGQEENWLTFDLVSYNVKDDLEYMFNDTDIFKDTLYFDVRKLKSYETRVMGRGVGLNG